MKSYEQRAFVRHWFLSHFEDPVNETPHDSEDGYLYMYGGPYDAATEIHDAFGIIVDEEVLQEVIRDVEQLGIEWAPTSLHQRIEERIEDREDIDDDMDDDIDDIHLRAQVRHAMDEANRALEEIRPKKIKHGGIGHNRPPDSNSIPLPLSQQDFSDIDIAFSVLRLETEGPTPAAEKVETALQQFTRSAIKVATWFGRTEFGKKFNQALGAGSAAILLTKIAAALGALHILIQTIHNWIPYIISSF